MPKVDSTLGSVTLNSSKNIITLNDIFLITINIINIKPSPSPHPYHHHYNYNTGLLCLLTPCNAI